MKDMLIPWVKELALEFGDFTLASGAKSNYYLDCRKLTLHSQGLTAVCNVMFDELEDLRRSRTIHFDAIGGPCVGADPIVGAMLQIYGEINTPGFEMRGFLIRKEAKAHGKGGLVIGSVKPGDKVVLIEDVATSGGSLLRAADEICRFGCTVVRAMVIVDRLQGAAEEFAARGIPFHSLLTIQDLGL
jgi:orotate phosphoribosyltransferase